MSQRYCRMLTRQGSLWDAIANCEGPFWKGLSHLAKDGVATTDIARNRPPISTLQIEELAGAWSRRMIAHRAQAFLWLCWSCGRPLTGLRLASLPRALGLCGTADIVSYGSGFRLGWCLWTMFWKRGKG